MTDNIPKISIGMPVYNGEEYIKAALDSILAQTFADFELIISDNASTDTTEEICRGYAAKDRRIRYLRNDANIGASHNFNRVFQLSSGEYFKWAAHDDVLDPSFLSKCSSMLDQDKSVVLCYTYTARIDKDGRRTGEYKNDNEARFDSQRQHSRFRAIIDTHHWNMVFYGLIRADALRKTQLLGSYVGSDRCLIAELGLLGGLCKIPEYLFFRREHEGASVHKFKNPQERLSWHNPSKAGAVYSFPTWRCGIENIRSVRWLNLPVREKLFCYVSMLDWGAKNRKKLYGDLTFGLRQALLNSRLGSKLLEIRRHALRRT